MVRALLTGRLAMLSLIAVGLNAAGCTGTIVGDFTETAGDGGATAQADSAPGQADEATGGGQPDAAPTGQPDAAPPPPMADASPPPPPDASPGLPGSDMEFNIILRQSVQACSGCGIWFHWQEVQSQKPRLVVQYQHGGQGYTAEYQHGLNGMNNAHSFTLSPYSGWDRHSMLVKQSPQYSGLFRADISDIPAGATITSATLHLHLETQEGLAFTDFSSVLEVHHCERPWSWDEANWTQFANGQPWSSAGGDFGQFIRQIRAKEDIHDRGFSKANPNVDFDFTSYVQQLQASR